MQTIHLHFWEPTTMLETLEICVRHALSVTEDGILELCYYSCGIGYKNKYSLENRIVRHHATHPNTGFGQQIYQHSVFPCDIVCFIRDRGFHMMRAQPFSGLSLDCQLHVSKHQYLSLSDYGG